MGTKSRKNLPLLAAVAVVNTDLLLRIFVLNLLKPGSCDAKFIKACWEQAVTPSREEKKSISKGARQLNSPIRLVNSSSQAGVKGCLDCVFIGYFYFLF